MDYELLEKQMIALAEEDNDPIPVLANASALLNESLETINWVGFYIAKGDRLVLGPFQGKPACVRIEKGRGVCGTAFAENRSQLVPDVHEFPGHIACDSASESEIVIPLRDKDGNVVAVLDIDSPVKGRFTADDLNGLSHFAEVLQSVIVF